MQQRQQTGGRGKAYLFLGVSLIAAVVAAVLVVKLIDRANRQLEEARKPKETVDVVIATRNLYMGLPIAEGDVAVRGMAPEMVPADVVFTSADMLIGRTPKERILANEIVRSERLARKEAGIGLNALISNGKRAVAIAVKAEEAVAGFIQPGNYVDLIVVIRPDDKSIGARAVSKTLLQGIKVLAVGSSLNGTEEAEEPADPKAKRRSTRDSGVVKGKRTVTLEVLPTEAESIALSVAEGDITLALRADIDIEQVVTNGVVADQLVGVEVEAESKPSTTMRAKPRTAPTTTAAEPDGPTVVSGSKIQQLEVTEGGAIQEADKRKKR